MNQIFAVMDREPRIKLKRGGHQVKIITNPANAWIGVHARNDRVFIGSLPDGTTKGNHQKDRCCE